MITSPRRTARAFLPLLLSLLPFVTFAAPARAQEQGGAIAGTVRDSATATPLSAVAVEVVGSEGVAVASQMTDARGAFRIAGLDPGTYALRFTVPGWQTLEIQDVEVSAGQTASLSPSLVEFSYNLNPITVSGQKGTQKLVEAQRIDGGSAEARGDEARERGDAAAAAEAYDRARDHYRDARRIAAEFRSCDPEGFERALDRLPDDLDTETADATA
jgi:hypothetical protein